MLDERIQEIHEHVAIILEREIDTEDQDKDDFEKQVRVFHHWNASGHFINAAELALKIGGELMLLGLNSQSILLFDDVLNTLKDSSADQFEEMHGGKMLMKLPTCHFFPTHRPTSCFLFRCRHFYVNSQCN